MSVHVKLSQTETKTDPPYPVHGIHDPPNRGWIPLHDMTLAPEERISTFARWVCAYYLHPNLSSRDPSQLIDRVEDVKLPSLTGATPEELANMVDTTTDAKGEGALAGTMDEECMTNVLKDRMKKALLNPEVRKTWGEASFWCIYGDQSPWNVIWGVWQLEDLSKSIGLPLTIKAMEGANHFVSSNRVLVWNGLTQVLQVMYDDPEQVIETIKSCLGRGRRSL